ncbi:MAG: hypothetical protein GC153_05605 [Alphaproteobacteria bacterium]|nr:hypothetical protein [Alphaproteobacteria bacterium]
MTRTCVQTWEEYLGGIEGITFTHALKKNIAHRLQMAEFEAALILQHKIIRTETNNQRGTLLETVLRFKIHYFCILSNSILEGIGSCIARKPLLRKLHTSEWQNALAHKANISKQRITAITSIRDKIHLDRINKDSVSQFNQLSYDDCFVPTYDTFKEVMTAMNADWPANCVLNETIPNGGEVFSALASAQASVNHAFGV